MKASAEQDCCENGSVPIPTFSVFALNHFSTSMIDFMESVCKTFDYAMGHTHSILRMRVKFILNFIYTFSFSVICTLKQTSVCLVVSM